MYFLYLIITVLAFIFNIFIVTNSTSGKQVGIAPVIQLVFIIPIFISCSLIFYFTKNTNLGQNYQHLYILLPFLLEIAYFAFTKDLFSIFKADGFVIRSYVLSIGLATITVFFINWLFIKIF